MDDGLQVEELRTKFFHDVTDGVSSDGTQYDPADLERVKTRSTFLQFLLDEWKGDVGKALTQLKAILSWRNSFGANVVEEGQFEREVLERGSVYFHNEDKNGHKILILRAKFGKRGDKEHREIGKKLLVFWLEQEYWKPENDLKTIVVLFDMTDSGFSNVDLEFLKFQISCFTYYYPGLVAIWKIVKQLLDAETVSRIKFVSRKTIGNYIAPDQLWAHMGGLDHYQYQYDDFFGSKLRQVQSEPAFQTHMAHGIPNHQHQHHQDQEPTHPNAQTPPDLSNSTDLLVSPDYKRAESERSGSRTPVPELGDDLDAAGVRPSSTTAVATTKQPSTPRLYPSRVSQISEGESQLSFGTSPAQPPESGAQYSRHSMENRSTGAFQSEPTSCIVRCMRVRPKDNILFELTSAGQCVGHLDIANLAQTIPIAYKIRTTSQDKYKVPFSVGVLGPGSTQDIDIIMKHEYDILGITGDKFQILAVELTPGAKQVDSTIWQDRRLDFMQVKLQCKLGASAQVASARGTNNIRHVIDAPAEPTSALRYRCAPNITSGPGAGTLTGSGGGTRQTQQSGQTHLSAEQLARHKMQQLMDANTRLEGRLDTLQSWLIRAYALLCLLILLVIYLAYSISS